MNNKPKYTHRDALARCSCCRWTPLGCIAIPGTASPEDVAALELLRLAEEAARERWVDRAARAICRERCAFMGEPPCFEIEGEWPNPECCEPGCMAEASVALAAMRERNHG